MYSGHCDLELVSERAIETAIQGPGLIHIMCFTLDVHVRLLVVKVTQCCNALLTILETRIKTLKPLG